MTYRLLIEYDGTPFCGWQIQPGQPSVQEALETALEVVLRERPKIVGSGRTDSGVHAKGQVAHFNVDSSLDPLRLKRSLNGLLPPAIAVRAIDQVPDDFHARYDARQRRYRYYVSTVPVALERHMRWFLRPEPDFDAMSTAAPDLLGTHDFETFCRTQSETRNRTCTVHLARWVREERPGEWYFEIAADRFLHGMVRAIVGTLVQIGHGKRSSDTLPGLIDAADRRAAGFAAPPHGLVLEEVVY